MPRRVQAVVVCEDLQHDTFIRRMLKLLGYGNHQIRVVPYPDGEGCGEQHVREKYPVEVRENRRRFNHRNGCLVTVIDADRFAVNIRHRQLNEALMNSGLPPRRQGETIAIFIPRWHIETWIHYLLSSDGLKPEDEKCSYFDGNESACHPAVDRLLAIAREMPYPSDCPPSLQLSLPELSRIPQ